jgi:hypothetical protein
LLTSLFFFDGLLFNRGQYAEQNEKKNHYLLKEWKPENAAFWENKGKQIAQKSLHFRRLFATRLLRLDAIQRRRRQSQ